MKLFFTFFETNILRILWQELDVTLRKTFICTVMDITCASPLISLSIFLQSISVGVERSKDYLKSRRWTKYVVDFACASRVNSCATWIPVLCVWDERSFSLSSQYSMREHLALHFSRGQGSHLTCRSLPIFAWEGEVNEPQSYCLKDGTLYPYFS